MFASPDVGGIKRARSFAKFFDAELAVCDKYRKEANKVESMRLIGEVEGKDVVLVDDLVDTAGTICKAAVLLKEKGAKTVRAVCTHAVLSGKAYENIENSVLEEIAVSDTIPLKQASTKDQSAVRCQPCMRKRSERSTTMNPSVHYSSNFNCKF